MSYDRTIEPTSITQGERVAWTRTFDDYPASLWTCEYRFRGLLGTGVGVNVTATADDTSFDVVLTAVQTTDLAVTQYGWQAWVTEIADATNQIRVADGLLKVEAGFASGDVFSLDARTPARIMLDTLDAALLASGSADVVEYQVSTPGGMKHVKRAMRSEVMALRKYWATVVAQQQWRARARRTGSFSGSVKVRMYED